ncbi:MAG TPA: sensor histidine kinase [Gaiellaceae bacterium]|nr:sensor histidine kinase [Gaiellaceae bacterium]
MTNVQAGSTAGFVHEAFLYEGSEEFLRRAVPFVREGLEAGEEVLVIVSAEKIRRLREALGADAERVHFADMAVVGANPARIIPAWRDFVEEHARGGKRVRGIGEPVWSGRSPAELAECHRHEALLNVAFADADAWILCPYDKSTLDESVVEEALRTHPLVVDGDGGSESPVYEGLEAIASPFGDPLPEPPADAAALDFDAETLPGVRGFITVHAVRAGLSAWRRNDLVLAVNEVATNSVRHGGGSGTLRLWRDDEFLYAEVSDGGRIDRPLAGRERPSREHESGRGLWIANQLCELVQVRSFPDGNAVRLHMRLD